MGDFSGVVNPELMALMQSEHKRLDEENKRQNKRLELLENQLSDLNILTTSVEKLAVSVEVIGKELTRQGNRLEELEKRDGETWRQIKYYVLTASIGIALGLLVKGL